MAISTRAELRTAVTNWLITSYDTDRIDEWIALGEAEVNRLLIAKGGIRDMETSADLSLTASTRTVALPTRFRSARRVYLDTSPITKLKFIDPLDYWEKYISSETSKPLNFSFEGDDMLVGPIPDTSYTAKMLYFQGFAPLSDSVSTNDLLTNHPDIYLAATLKWGWTFKAVTEPPGTTWDALMQNSIEQLVLSNRRDRYSGDVLVMRTDVGNPPQY